MMSAPPVQVTNYPLVEVDEVQEEEVYDSDDDQVFEAEEISQLNAHRDSTTIKDEFNP